MRMASFREKFLFEKMGLQFNHCFQEVIYTPKGVVTSGEYFLLLWKWASNEKWWPKFKEEVIGQEGDGSVGPLYWPIKEEYVDPENFANGLYVFFNPELIEGEEEGEQKCLLF